MIRNLLIATLAFLSAVPASSSDVIATFREHCVSCHGQEGKTKGKVDLLAIDSLAMLASDPDLLADVIDVIEFEEMPPEDEPPLPENLRETTVQTLRGLLRETVTSSDTLPRIPIRRMNRFQYANAVKDLFELRVEVFSLPERMLREHGGYFRPDTGKMPDAVRVGSRPLGKSQMIEPRLADVAAFPQDLRAEHGFDNQADHLSLSPLLMESFLGLGRSIVESPDFTAKNVGIWSSLFSDLTNGDLPETEVRRRLRPFLRRAFRRPVNDEILTRYTNYTLNRIRGGATFTEAMRETVSAVLASPRFLYQQEGASESPSPEALDGFELASRLSFFLWGSLPDDTLLELADSGELLQPEIYAAQFDRMLDDRKLKRFCDSFPAQWLQLDRIITSVPDPEKFPQFYFAKYRVSMHMMLEPLLLFETVLVENRSVLDLIDPNFSYRSELLDHWYAEGKKSDRIPPTSIPFQRVSLTNRREGGVITNAATMTMTSNATRSQPITRGAWIATVIFHDPPKPPPGDVPPLPEDPAGEEMNMTLRERLDAHREHESYKGCHAQIDPLGFAMENYGPVGLWRDTYENGRRVDASGTLFRKHEFENPVAFKDAILAERDRFVRAFASHLLSFALGREVVGADATTLDEIVAKAEADDYRIQALLRAIVESRPFRYKSNPPASEK